MARREILVDDLDGKESDDIETRHFVVGHQAFTIDLSAKNYEQFLKDMEKWMSKATPLKATGGSQTARRAGGRSGGSDRDYNPAEVRAWAASQGITVSPRGRIHGDVVKQFKEANG